jgi:hypothetical protein
MRNIGWQQEHFTFFNGNVFKLSIVNDFQEHIALVLIEPFLIWKALNSLNAVQNLSFLTMIISSNIWPANCHHNKVSAMDQIIVHWRSKFVFIFLNPFSKVNWWQYHDHFENGIVPSADYAVPKILVNISQHKIATADTAARTDA